MTDHPLAGHCTYRLLEPDFTNISYDHMLKSDALRHQIRLHRNATHGYYLVDDNEDPNSKELFKFCSGDDPYAALEQVKLNRVNFVSPAPSATPTTTPTETEIPATLQHVDKGVCLQDIPSFDAVTWSESSASFGSTPGGMSDCSTNVVRSEPLPQHVHVIGAPHARLLKADLQRTIDEVERNSLIPMYTVVQSPDDVLNTFYAINMSIDEQKSREFAPYARKNYKLLVDTGETITWIYAQGFQFMTDVHVDKNPTVTPRYTLMSPTEWMEKDHPEWTDVGAWKYRKSLPTPSGVDAIESVTQRYYDGMIVNLERWGKNYPIPALFPSYDWERNADSRSYVPLPRVLATAVMPGMAARPYDGILGLCMLRTSGIYPFRADTNSNFVKLADAMRYTQEHGEQVQTTEEFTLRLRYPGGRIEANDRSGSFLYFGDIWPCSLSTSTTLEIPLVPSFTENIPIVPSIVSSSRERKVFAHYAVHATLVTLYIPKHAQASHASTDAKDWTSMPIHLSDPASTSAPFPGLRMILDSGSGHSYFPTKVVKEIAIQWLGDPRDVDEVGGLYCKTGHTFDKCDLVFRFVGVGGREVDYRCNAGHFLTSPWHCEGGVRSPIRATNVSKDELPCTLGMNFFWTAFVRHVHGPADPYIQLAPQRFIDAVGHRFEQQHIKLHEGLPPRLEAIRLGTTALDMN